MALVGRKVLVHYAVGGPRLWHERYVLAHVAGDTYMVATPDRDVYPEELGLLNTDIRTLKVRPLNGAVPVGVNAAEIYGLPNWAPAELQALRDEAQQQMGPAVPVAPVAVAAAAAPGGLIGTTVDPETGYPGGTLKWLAAETSNGVTYGQEVAGIAVQMVRGKKHVHVGPAGEQLFVECVDGADFWDFLQRPAHLDMRVLPIKLNALLQPERSLAEVASMCKESKVLWKLSGPRTSRWCVNYLAIENLGFEGHHERLRTITKADASSWGIQEHFQVSMALRQALLIDQLDAFNLLTIELQFRRLQTIEFSYAEKAREMESKAVGGKLSLEEQTTYGGVTRQYSTLMVCPELLTHVKEETEKEASLAKNLRKAREEREAARKNKGGKAKEDP